MTPPALTPAARGSTTQPRPKTPRQSSPRGAGHRTQVRRATSPRAPRRVSGPAGGVVVGGVIAAPAPVTAPARPRPKRAPRSQARPSVARAPWSVRSAAFVQHLPDHALLDRIVRGRAWIPLLGVLLAGIVAMQVEVLKLNAGIGRSLERGSALQTQNELLRASVARLSDEQRIERIAARMGMLMPGPGQEKFVTSGRGAVERARGAIHAPNATDFLARLPTIGAPAAAQGTSTNVGLGLAATGTSSASGTTAGTGTTATAGTGASAGTTATAGTSATAAQAGTASTTGTTGAGGTAGSATGTAGSSGTSGTAGSSGTSGTAGSSGTSGTAGSSGTSSVTPTPTGGATQSSSASGGAGATPVGG